jgi:hypothetical protein
MLASTVVATLQALIAEHGDLPVWLTDPDTGWILDIDLEYTTCMDGKGYDMDTAVAHIAIESGYEQRFRVEPVASTPNGEQR